MPDPITILAAMGVAAATRPVALYFRLVVANQRSLPLVDVGWVLGLGGRFTSGLLAAG